MSGRGGPCGIRALRGAALAAAFAAAAAAAQDYGDTPYVPTPQNVVEKMLEIAKVGPQDFVIDLGSGDGRMIITAAKKFGARGFGVDHDRQLVALSNRLASEAGVAPRAVFYQRDLYRTDVSAATVVTMYLLPEVNLMVRPKLLAELRPGARIVSHDYDMGEWEPDLQLELDAPGKPVGVGERSKIFLWVVPADAAGRWRWRLDAGPEPLEFEASFEQEFQKIRGVLRLAGRKAALEEARLEGTRIRFAATAGRARYAFEGRLAGDTIEGSARIARAGLVRTASWRAERVERWLPRHVAEPESRVDPYAPK
jgi:hypothetical protein